MSFRKCNRKSPKYGIVRQAVLFIGCIISAGLVIYSSACHTRLALYGIKANATVVHVKQSGRNRTVTIRFSNDTGQLFDVKNDFPLFVGRPEVGDAVPIIFHPSQPEICVVQGMKGFADLFIALSIFGIYGICVFPLLFLRKESHT